MGINYDNTAFYKSKEWRRVSAAYMASKFYICERCGKPAQICHHKTWLNGSNVSDPNVALSFDNLEALCLECHNAEHGRRHNVTIFNSDGTIAGVKESQGAKTFILQRAAIDAMIDKLKPIYEKNNS